jgi:predicted enzyme related to lactoylglutathione lyase
MLALLAAGCTTGARWPTINDEATNVHSPGRWIWAELFTADIPKARDFYGKVFGWDFEERGQGEDGYVLIRADGHSIAGMVHHVNSKENGRSGQWLRLMSVPDVGRVAEYAAGAGGEIVLAPRQLKGRGEVAVFADPEGALFGTIHSDSGDPPDVFPAINTWLWNELWAKDVKRMSEFYRDIAGFEVKVPPSDKALAPDRPEVFLVASGYPRAGIVEQQREDLPSAWLPYVRVKDLRATLERVAQAGGEVVVEPSPEIRAGRIAVFTDSLGAAIGIAEWAHDDADKE